MQDSLSRGEANGKETGKRKENRFRNLLQFRDDESSKMFLINKLERRLKSHE